MASKKERQRILSGGLNLLPPSDKIQDGEALLLDNWRVDQLGQLRSRKGAGLEASQIGSGVFHTLTRAGPDRYAGIGTSLYWGTFAQTQIASGFDGQPLGMAFFLGNGWVMNRANRVRISGPPGAAFTTSNWGIAAPATAPTPQAGAQQFTTIEGFDYADEPHFPGVDIGYQDSNGVFHDNPTQIATNQGTIDVTNGSVTVIGHGTNWDSTMVGLAINFVATNMGVINVFSGVIASVLNPGNLTLNSPFPWDTATGLLYEIDVGSTAIADLTNFQQGTASLKVNAYTVALWVVTDNLLLSRGAGVDTRTAGNAGDDDEFRIWVYCTNPSAVDEISVVLDSGPSGVANTAAFVTMPGTVLNQTPKTWTYLRIRRTVDIDDLLDSINSAVTVPDPNSEGGFLPADPALLSDLQSQLNQRLAVPYLVQIRNGQMLTGISVDQLGIGSDPKGSYSFASQVTTVDWSNITGLQVLLSLNAPTIFNLDYAHFVGNIPASLTGTGTYFVSFANADDEDSDPSPASVSVTAQNQSIELFSVPTSPDPQVTQRWIYRIGFGSSQALLVGKLNDNSTTTFADSLSVNDAQNQGITMPINRTLPPAALGVAGPFHGKLLAFSTVDHPARFFWNNSAIPWAFPGADDDQIGNWEDAGSDDDPLLGITIHGQVALMYKQRSLWRLPGDPADPNVNPEQTDATIGVVGPKAFVNGGNLDYFMAAEGIYSRNYDTAQKISPMLDPIFKGDSVHLSNGEYIPPISKAWISQTVMAIANDRLYVSYVEEGNSLPSVTLICQLPGAIPFGSVPPYHWYRMKLNTTSIAAPQGFTALNYEGGPFLLMAGVTGNYISGGIVLSAGYLFQLDVLTTDAGQYIYLTWQSRFSDQGLPDNYKRYCDLEIDYQTAFNNDGLSVLTVIIVYDNGELPGTKVTLGQIFSATRTTTSFSLRDIQISDEDLRAKNISIRIEGPATSTCIIYGTYLHWYPEERVGLVFDSGFTDLGAPERVKQVDYIELVTTGSGQALGRGYKSDLPGSILTQQLFDQITMPTGRATTRTRLPSIVEGRNHRFVLSGSTPFQLHAVRLRQRVLGEYMDGTVTPIEFYQSPEFSVAPGRVGELKDFLLDYDTGGGAGSGGSVVILSDLPNYALTAVRTLQLPARSTRAPFIFALEDAADSLPYGQLFQVRIYPPPGGVLRLHGRAVFRARILGVFFDGSKGEIWETQPLDLFGGIAQYRELAIVAQTLGPMTFQMLTELPNKDMQVVASFPVYTAGTTAGRLPVYQRLQGTTKGQLTKFRLIGPYATRLFEVRVFGRGLGTTETDWQWVNVPMEATPNEWAQIQMPVRETPPEFTWVDLAVDAIE